MPPTAGRRHDALSLKAPRSPGISPRFPPFRLQGLHFLGRPPPPRACGSAPPAPARASWAPLPSDGPSASGEGPLPLPAGRLRTTFPACSRRPPRISTSPPAAPCPRRPRLSPPRASARTRSFSYRCPWRTTSRALPSSKTSAIFSRRCRSRPARRLSRRGRSPRESSRPPEASSRQDT